MTGAWRCTEQSRIFETFINLHVPGVWACSWTRSVLMAKGGCVLDACAQLHSCIQAC